MGDEDILKLCVRVETGALDYVRDECLVWVVFQPFMEPSYVQMSLQRRMKVKRDTARLKALGAVPNIASGPALRFSLLP